MRFRMLSLIDKDYQIHLESKNDDDTHSQLKIADFLLFLWSNADLRDIVYDNYCRTEGG